MWAKIWQTVRSHSSRWPRDAPTVAPETGRPAGPPPHVAPSTAPVLCASGRCAGGCTFRAHLAALPVSKFQTFPMAQDKACAPRLLLHSSSSAGIPASLRRLRNVLLSLCLPVSNCCPSEQQQALRDAERPQRRRGQAVARLRHFLHGISHHLVLGHSTASAARKQLHAGDPGIRADL